MSQKASSVAKIAHKRKPQVRNAREAIKGWMGSAVRSTKANPGRAVLGSVLGALAIGLVVAKVTRFV
jgi:hypothetical protein